MDYEEHIRNLYCYEDELPCELTSELFEASFLDGVRLYPWKAVAKQLEAERDALVRLLKYKGDHHWTCQSTHLTGLPCDCGYDEAYQAIPEDTQKEIEGESRCSGQNSDGLRVI